MKKNLEEHMSYKAKRKKEDRMKKSPDGKLDLEDAWDTLIETGKYPLFKELVAVIRHKGTYKDFLSKIDSDTLFKFTQKHPMDSMGEDGLITASNCIWHRAKNFTLKLDIKEITEAWTSICCSFVMELYSRSKLAVIIWPKDPWDLDLDFKLNGKSKLAENKKEYDLLMNDEVDVDFINKYTSKLPGEYMTFLVQRSAGKVYKRKKHEPR